MGENHFARLPTALYGIALLLAAVAYYLLQKAMIKHQGEHGVLAKALGNDFKGKASLILYLAGIASAFILPSISHAIYVLVAIIWLLPDRRIENVLEK